MDPAANSRNRRRSARLLGAPILALGLLGALLPSGLNAQESEEGIGLRLVGQPVWHRPADNLDVRLLISNDSDETLEGFRISVGIDDRRTSRSDLHDSYAAVPGSEATVLPFDFRTRIAPGGSELVTIDEPIASFSTLAVATEGGVYPATYRLQDASGFQDLDFVSSPVVYYPQTPETPLDVVMLLPMNDDPSIAPDGQLVEDEEGSVPLQEAAADGGWFTGWLDALESTAVPAPLERDRDGEGGRRKRNRRNPPPPPRPLRLALAPTPRLLEELADMSDGYTTPSGDDLGEQSPEARGAAAALDRFKALLAEDTIEPVLVPYSFPDIPTLLERLGLEHALAQMSTATTVVRETTGVNLNDPWFFPPAGRIDERTLQQLQDARYGAKTFFSGTAIPFSDDPTDSGCPDSSPSFTCPISIETVTGMARGFVTDQEIAERLSFLQAGTDDRVYLQQFFAETSMIHEELPAVAGRVVQVTTPSLWHPTPRLARVLLQGLQDAPWIRTVTPDEAFKGDVEVERREIIETADQLENTPDTTYFEAISQADEVIDSYGTMVPPTSERLRRLSRNVLVSESRTWWRDPLAGTSYATGSSEEARAEMEKVRITVAEGTTFTSRSGAILLLVSNSATYPVKVAIRFDSPGLEFDRTAIIDTYEPGNTDLTVDARATSSGGFPLAVSLETIDGFVISTQEITITSTSFNEIALGITIGALAFLVLFYVVRAVRKRRPRETTSE